MNIVLLLLLIIALAVLLKFSLNLIIIVAVLAAGYYGYKKYYLKQSVPDVEEESIRNAGSMAARVAHITTADMEEQKR